MRALGLVVLAIGLVVLPSTDVVGRRLAWLSRHRLALTDSTEPIEKTRNEWRALADRIYRVAGTDHGARMDQRSIMNFAALVATAVGIMAFGVVPGLLLGLVGRRIGGCVQRAAHSRLESRSRRELQRAVSALADEHDAGAGVSQALRSAASVAGQWRGIFEVAAEDPSMLAETGPSGWLSRARVAMADRQIAGREWVDLDQTGSENLVTACAVATRSGARLTAALNTIAADLQAELVVRRAVAAGLAGPRSSAALLAGLPVLGIGLGSAMGADPLNVLLHTPVGLVALCAGVVLDLAGLAWTQRLVRGAMP